MMGTWLKLLKAIEGTILTSFRFFVVLKTDFSDSLWFQMKYYFGDQIPSCFYLPDVSEDNSFVDTS